MKTLFLLRHAKSSWEDSALNDFDRPLNERGEKDAPRMGQRLKEQKVSPGIIYSSNAVRALTTARIVAHELGCPESVIHADRKIYQADGDGLLDVVQHAPDETNSIMIVGHNPTLTQFVNDLSNETIENIPTAGVVTCQLNINSWKKATWSCARMVAFDFPKAT